MNKVTLLSYTCQAVVIASASKKSTTPQDVVVLIEKDKAFAPSTNDILKSFESLVYLGYVKMLGKKKGLETCYDVVS